ncbi:hsdR (plasmid) [Kosakonia sp. ML.JS2a]|uniref:hsdR n=1 Tax=Kosakonia sp. ML.JS2a TaxID=2980557 RepID=UPI0021D8CE3A|nr:hsdR [Kosakonia sp. ML.JS2a]UXY13492.1 hsdR [Kosakonia sp. ML.JS2a]
MNDNNEEEYQAPELSPEVEALIDNGMAFLEKAMNEVKTAPKFSVVSFWTAVEIMLKVPLAQEHWTLVCSGKSIKRQAYLTGDFQSITFQESCDKLRDVLEKPVPQTTLFAFDIVRKHRNRVVHFFHDAYTTEDMDRLLTEQANAWFALNRLMRDDWKDLFEGALGNLLARNETRLLIQNKFYAAKKYEQIKDNIRAARQNGHRITKCSVCEQRAVVWETVASFDGRELKSGKCRVCTTSLERTLTFACPNCDKPQTIDSDSDVTFLCSACGHTDNLYHLLDTSSVDSDSFATLSVPAGCCECDGYNSVCEFGDGFLCIYCLTYFDNLQCCEHCSYYSSEVPAFSSMVGCRFCDGHRETWGND